MNTQHRTARTNLGRLIALGGLAAIATTACGTTTASTDTAPTPAAAERSGLPAADAPPAVDLVAAADHDRRAGSPDVQSTTVPDPAPGPAAGTEPVDPAHQAGEAAGVDQHDQDDPGAGTTTNGAGAGQSRDGDAETAAVDEVDGHTPEFVNFDVSQDPNVEQTGRIAAFVSDDDGDATTLVVDWGDGHSSEYGLADTSIVDTHAYADPGLYQVTATARDAAGHETTMSDIIAFDLSTGPATTVGQPLVDWSTCETAADGPDVRFFEAATYSAWGTSQWVVDPGAEPLTDAEIIWNDGTIYRVDPITGTLDHQFDRTEVLPAGGAVLRVRDAAGNCAGSSSSFARPIVPIYDVTFHGVWIEATDSEACRQTNLLATVGVFDQAGIRLNDQATGVDLADSWQFHGGPQRVKVTEGHVSMPDQRLDWSGPRSASWGGLNADIGPVSVVASLYVNGETTTVAPTSITTTTGPRHEWRSPVDVDGCSYELIVVTESVLQGLPTL